MKPLIGVMPLWDEERDSIWMLPGYMDGLSEAGGTPIIFPFTTDRDEVSRLVGMCDGLLFTGGQDVDPSLYNEEPLNESVVSCQMRDDMEAIILKEALDTDKPILGICRGIQYINVALGGTLYQDIPTQHPSDTEHHQLPPYHVPAHDVTIAQNSPLYECLATETLPVTSYHHQAVKDVAPSLNVMAISTDGLIEAVYKPDCKFLWALQWHPEFSHKTDAASRKIFSAFVAASGNLC